MGGVPIHALRIFPHIVRRLGRHFGRFRSGILAHRVNHPHVQIGRVTLGAGLTKTRDGIRPLAQTLVILAHVKMQLAQPLFISGKFLFDHFERNDVALCPFAAAPPLGHSLRADLFGERTCGQLFEHLLREFCCFRIDRLIVDQRVVCDRQSAVSAANLSLRLPLPDGTMGICRRRAVGRLIQYVGEPHFDGRCMLRLAVAIKKLPAGGGHVAVAGCRFQTVNPLQHHVGVARGRRRGRRRTAARCGSNQRRDRVDDIDRPV